MHTRHCIQNYNCRFFYSYLTFAFNSINLWQIIHTLHTSTFYAQQMTNRCTTISQYRNIAVLLLAAALVVRFYSVNTWNVRRVKANDDTTIIAICYFVDDMLCTKTAISFDKKCRQRKYLIFVTKHCSQIKWRMLQGYVTTHNSNI